MIPFFWFLVGGVLEAMVLSLVAPASPTRPHQSRWKPFWVSLVAGLAMLVLGLFPGRHGTVLVTGSTSAIFVFLLGLSITLAAVLRSMGRMPALDEATLAVTTGAFWFAMVAAALEGALLAYPLLAIGLVLTVLVLRAILPRAPLAASAKKLAYFWMLYVGLAIGAVSWTSPDGGILFRDADAFSLVGGIALGMAFTFLLTQAFLALVLLIAERGVSRQTVDEAIAEGYVTNAALFPRLVSDSQVAPAVLVALAVGTLAALWANHAAQLTPDGTALGIVTAAAPALGMWRARSKDGP